MKVISNTIDSCKGIFWHVTFVLVIVSCFNKYVYKYSLSTNKQIEKEKINIYTNIYKDILQIYIKKFSGEDLAEQL